MNYDLVIFDLDGTLLDTAPDIGRCLNRALTEHDLSTFSRERLLSVIGPAGRAFYSAIVGSDDDDKIELAKQVVKEYRAYYWEGLVEETRPFPGVTEMLDRLKELGVTMAVASNKPEAQVRKIVSGLGLDHYFAQIVGPESVENAKPDPEVIHLMMKRCDSTPERTMMVGDTHNDVSSGHSAGVTTVFVKWGYQSDVDRDLIDAEISDAAEITAMVEG
jgi:2-phosphoglycolate phosphatase